ncbi:hypothetical protein FQN54_005940 [Arachnomyces sp. PD_36]|nr:hypothetical protein FQN54_005940 [Arachnomyces sp. PD_36]
MASDKKNGYLAMLLYDPFTGHSSVAGIAQHRIAHSFGPVPRDPQKARIGHGLEMFDHLGEVDQFLLADMFLPELSDRQGLLGYLVHAHCWVLVDRVIGLKLVERELRLFVEAIRQFWKEKHDLWGLLRININYEDAFYPAYNRLRKTRQIAASSGRRNLKRCVDTSKNPVIVPELQTLINRAVSGHSTNDYVPLRSQHAAVFDVPLEIAMMIVGILYKYIYYSQASINDLRNMLTAFQWKLPDSYWQSRCKKDLIFEVDDLIRSNDQAVDWQFLCLGIEELLLKKGWYDYGGLKNRGRTLHLLQGIKNIFLEKIKQQDEL